MVKKALTVWLAILLTAFLVTGCTSTPQIDGTKMPDPIKLAVTDIQGLEELQRDFGFFREELEKTLGVKVKFFPVSDRTAAVAALETGQVDLVFTGPAEYVVIRAKTGAKPVIGITRPNYHSLIVVHADSPYLTLQDLKGKKVAMSDVGSTSGHLGPSKILIDAGLKPGTDVETLTLGDGFLTAFYNKDTDALGCNLTDLEILMKEMEVEKDQLRVLQQGPALPNDVFVLNDNYTDEVVAEIRDKMKENESNLVDAILKAGSGDTMKYEGAELVPADDKQYDYVRGMYEAIGVNDFSEFVGD